MLYIFSSNKSSLFFVSIILKKCIGITRSCALYDPRRYSLSYRSIWLIRHQRRHRIYFSFFFLSLFTIDEIHQSKRTKRIYYYFAKDITKRQYFISCFLEAADSPVKCARVAAVRAISRGIHLYP